MADTGNHRVQKYSGGSWTIVTAGLANPHAVTVTSDGTVYVADTSNDRIVAYSASGTRVYGG